MLTVSALVMRLLGMVWQVWLARRVGPAGLGLYQLILNVGFLFATVAVSGIRYTVTRLLSEEMGLGRPGSVSAAMERAGAYALSFGCAAMAVLWFGAEAVGKRWIGDGRTVTALRWLAFSMPFTSLSAVLSGYFTAVGRVWKTAAEQFCEQLVRMGLTAAALGGTGGELSAVCGALALAGAGADALGCGALAALYALDRRRHALPGAAGERLTRRMFRLAVPLAVSAYARSALGTVRQLLVPRGLRLSGMAADSALAGYGVISAMALPVLFFPACLPGALAEMLVPELTEAQAAGEWERLRSLVSGLLRKTVWLSLAAGALFFVSADLLGGLLYHSADCARFLRLLSAMAPFVYTDIVTDGCLKGLGEMNRSMAYNVAEAALGLLLVWALLPRFGLGGYVFVLYVCEIFNFTLSIRRLRVLLGRMGTGARQ